MGDADEAQRLITLACPRTDDGQFYAPELAEEQTLENLERFSDRLDNAHKHLVAAGRCNCLKETVNA